MVQIILNNFSNFYNKYTVIPVFAYYKKNKTNILKWQNLKAHSYGSLSLNQPVRTAFLLLGDWPLQWQCLFDETFLVSLVVPY